MLTRTTLQQSRSCNCDQRVQPGGWLIASSISGRRTKQALASAAFVQQSTSARPFRWVGAQHGHVSARVGALHDPSRIGCFPAPQWSGTDRPAPKTIQGVLGALVVGIISFLISDSFLLVGIPPAIHSAMDICLLFLHRHVCRRIVSLVRAALFRKRWRTIPVSKIIVIRAGSGFSAY
jgi:hypothetical protein